MRRLGCLLLPVLLVACAGYGPRPTFLHTDSKPWNDWLNTTVSADFANVPLGSLTTRAPFEGLGLMFDGVDPEYRVALQVENVTRRQALWKLADSYGLAIVLDPAGQGDVPTVVMRNRELRRENRPLP